jgi:excisionase family DNA binding protein
MPKAANNPVRKAAPKPARKSRATLHTMSVQAPPPGTPYSIHDAIAAHQGPMSVPQLAPILGVSDDVLYTMVRTGRIPQLIIPGRTLIRFDPASVCHWLRRHNPILNQVKKAG